MKVKTISFDVWGTLVKPNPEYKKLRIDFLKYYNAEESNINSVLKHIKADVDKRAEKHGMQFNIQDLYSMILHSLNIEHKQLPVNDFISFCNSCMINNPPILMSETINLLELLKAKDYRIMLASNNVFSSGKIMRTVLMKLGIFDYFHDCIFSDEVGFAKPHHEFFKQLHQKSHTLTEQILHTGDNTNTDMLGARSYGMKLHLCEKGYDSTESVNKLLETLELNLNF